MKGYFKVLTKHPVIITRALHLSEYFVNHLPDQPIIHWVQIPFYLRNPQSLIEDRKYFRKNRPNDTLYYFYNESAVYYHLKNSGLNLVDSPLEAMYDIDTFHITTPKHKSHDALMVARATYMKRLELAKDVKSLKIISSIEDHDHFKQLKQIFKGRLLNLSLSREDLNIAYNAARVGLCLSTTEGAQRVILEHQMAGVPQVCTTSKGGRNRFINPETCLIVPPDPHCVAEAVKHLISMDLDPQMVREIMFRRLMGYRHKIFELGESILNAHGNYDFAAKMRMIMKKQYCLTPWCYRIERVLNAEFGLNIEEDTYSD